MQPISICHLSSTPLWQPRIVIMYESMFNFNRRINGITYYAGVVASLLVAAGATLITDLPTFGKIIDILIAVFILFVVVVLFIYWICITRQRANDVGWHPLILTLLTFWTPFFLLIGLLPGQSTPNKFGPSPSKGVNLR